MIKFSQTLIDPTSATLPGRDPLAREHDYAFPPRGWRPWLLVCALLLGGLTARASTLTVSSTADTGPGTLRAQIAAAAPGDTINFSVAGTITLTNGLLGIAHDLTIAGPGASNLTVTSSKDISMFGISNGVVGISSLTLSNGSANAGGAIDMTGGTVTVTGSTFSENQSHTEGGAIYMSGGSLAIISCAFSGNYSPDGGGISVAGGSLAVTNSTFVGNTGDSDGGSINIDSGSVTMTGCTISGGSAGYGGGIYSVGTATINDSTIYGNTAVSNSADFGIGGGIMAYGGSMTVVNSTISGNKASLGDNHGTIGGGGIANYGALLAIANSTVTLNSGGYGGGIFLYKGTLNLSNSIVASNSATNGADIYGAVAAGDYNLVQNPTNVTLSGSHNITGQAAMLGSLTNNGGPTLTHALLAGSPAIGAGDPNFNATSLPYDQRGPGFPRVSTGGLCIGAFELEPNQSGANFLVSTLADHDYGSCGPTNGSLREAIKYSPAGTTITFGVTGTIALTLGELLINKNLTITGPASAPGITVSGSQASRIFTVTQSTNPPTVLNLSTLTLTGGNGTGSLGSGSGGALYLGSFSPHLIVAVTNCTFFGNTTTGSGGAIQNSGTLTVTSSTFSGNTATGSGGAIQNAASLTVTSSTFSGNSAVTQGGGINFVNGQLNLYNTILAGNSAPNGPDMHGTVTTGDYDLVQNLANATLAGSHNITGQPALLGPLASYGGPTPTLALLPGSPAIDMGSTPLATDQRGMARPQGAAPDIGAFELGPIFPTTLSIQAIPLSQVQLSWYTVTNAAYQLQYTPVLNTNQWMPLTAWLAGGGQLISTNDAILAGQSQRFYRVGVTNSP